MPGLPCDNRSVQRQDCSCATIHRYDSSLNMTLLRTVRFQADCTFGRRAARDMHTPDAHCPALSSGCHRPALRQLRTQQQRPSVCYIVPQHTLFHGFPQNRTPPAPRQLRTTCTQVAHKHEGCKERSFRCCVLACWYLQHHGVPAAAPPFPDPNNNSLVRRHGAQRITRRIRTCPSPHQPPDINTHAGPSSAQRRHPRRAAEPGEQELTVAGGSTSALVVCSAFRAVPPVTVHTDEVRSPLMLMVPQGP